MASPASGQRPFLVRDIDPAYPRADNFQDFSFTRTWGSIGNKALFTAYRSNRGRELWVTQGAPDSTHPLVTAELYDPTFFDIVVNTGSLIYFNGPGGLWRTDGTRGGSYLLAPSNLESRVEESSPVIDGVLYFISCQPQTGCELWRTEGTPGTTRLLKDLEPGPAHSLVEQLRSVGASLAFLAVGKAWTSDGTAEGTKPLPNAPPSVAVAAVDQRLLLLKSLGPSEYELWAARPPFSSFYPLKRFTSFGLPGNSIRTAGGLAYFFATDPQQGTELWFTDGTAAGTRAVTDLPQDNPGFGQLAQVGGRFFFVALDNQGVSRLWTTAGGSVSTRAVVSGCQGGECPQVLSSTPLIVLGQRVAFLGRTGVPLSAAQVWTSDGTASGTVPLLPVRNVAVDNLQSAGGRAVFSVSADPLETWVTDGTRQGTTKVSDFRWDSFVTAERLLYFTDGGSEIHRTDGTSSRTELVTVVNRNGVESIPTAFVGLNGSAVFLACLDYRPRLWRSAGTSESLVALSSPLPTSSFYCPDFPFTRPRIYVSGDQGFLTEPSGMIWRTDLTGSGTRALGPEVGPDVVNASDAVPVAGGAAFLARRFDEDFFEESLELWATDGTTSGARAVVALLLGEDTGSFQNLQPFGSGRFLFAIPTDGDHNTDELDVWVSDGTASGTTNLGQVPGTIGPVVRVAELGYFLAGNSHLWRTDGTLSGTLEVFASGEPVETESTKPHFGGLGGTLYFGASIGSDSWGIWRSNGTEAGTEPLAPLPMFSSPPQSFVPVGELLFFVAGDETNGRELWVTDGTGAGTRLVADVFPGSAGSSPRALVASNGKLLFTARDGVHGYELWQSDGTSAGTRMLGDIAPGPLSSDPRDLTAIGDLLYFSADDALHGRELWAVRAGASDACQATDTTLCLGDGRFEVTTLWKDFQGNSGPGHAVALTADTGYFWFFNSTNVETVIKVLDGRGLNDHHWVFYGALSNVEYAITVRDTATGASRRYYNPEGQFASVGDTQGFGPLGAYSQSRPQDNEPQAMLVSQQVSQPKEACAASTERLCLNGGRFAVTAAWKDFAGNVGSGKAVGLTGDTGYFWFFDAANVEVVLKVLDGRALNSKFWVFYGALSSVEYTLTVTDTLTGNVRTYQNPSGRFASVGDTSAF